MWLAQGCTAQKGQETWFKPKLWAASHSWGVRPPLDSAAVRSRFSQGGPQASGAGSRGPPQNVLVHAAPSQAQALSTYLTKKEAAADGPVEPLAGVPGAGETRAAVQAPPRPHIFDMPSGPTGGGPSRTVSATATAATAASACRKGQSHLRNKYLLLGHRPTPPGTRPGPAHRTLPALGIRRSAPGTGWGEMPPWSLTLQPLPHQVPEMQQPPWSGQMDRDPVPLIPGLSIWEHPKAQLEKKPQ